MNERIKELAEQHGFIHSNMTVGEITDALKKFDKAVQIIVGECIQVCLEQRNPSNLNYKPSERFATALKQHFEVY